MDIILKKLIPTVLGKGSKPSAVITHTLKGKGASFMEDNNNWHYRIPNEEEDLPYLNLELFHEKSFVK